MGKGPTYPVVWREGDGPLRTGKLELVDGRIVLEGSEAKGALARRSVAYADLAEVRVGRGAAERLGNRPSLILEHRAGPQIRIGEISGLGSAVFDIGHVLAELLSPEGATARRLAVVVPIRKGARDRTSELIRKGAPFDPEASPLESHRVFLTDREAVFLFEGPDVKGFLEQLARTPKAWLAAGAWKDCIAGKPRVAEEEYSWTRRPRLGG